jgi:hypothetical protein
MLKELHTKNEFEVLVWHRDPPSQSATLSDLVLVFQKWRFFLDTESKCQYDDEGRGTPSKTVILNMT